MTEQGTIKSKISAKLSALGGGMLVIGAAVFGMGAMKHGFGAEGLEKIAPSFLYGAIFWVLLTMGCYGLTLLFHVTRGRWGTPVLRVFESGSNHVMLAYSFVLVMIGAVVFKDAIYGHWTQAPLADLIVQRKSHYLNYPFFLGRFVAYFLILGGIGWALRTWARQEELTGDPAYSIKRNNLSGAAIVVFFIVMTFFITDVLMSIDPHWFSTIWGFLFSVGAALTAMSLAVLVVVSQRNKAPFKGVVDELMMKDFGNLLLMLTMLWGYLSFSQLLIIWSGNLPEFTTYYLARLQGNFSLLGGVLTIGQFFLPFTLLLSPKLKRTPALLMGCASIILLMRFFDMHWLVAPYFRAEVTPELADLGSLLLFGGIWFLLFGMNLKGAPMVTKAHPSEDFVPELVEATENV